MKDKKIGRITARVVDLLELETSPGTPIFIGQANIEHIKSKHKYDYEQYGHLLEDIIAEPDYIGKRDDGSIEYVKEILVDNVYVKVAVRVSSNGTFFARTLYRLNNNRVNNFIEKGTLKKY